MNENRIWLVMIQRIELEGTLKFPAAFVKAYYLFGISLLHSIQLHSLEWTSPFIVSPF